VLNGDCFFRIDLIAETAGMRSPFLTCQSRSEAVFDCQFVSNQMFAVKDRFSTIA
jgi:hypothetical protein